MASLSSIQFTITQLSRLLLTAALLLPAGLVSAQSSELTYDNLEPVENPRLAMGFIDPDADFSVYKRVAIMEPYVAFRKNWKRDQNRSRTNKISNSDMEKLKADVATLFANVFGERLQSAGYAIVTEASDDVLLIRPAVVDLDISAPDTRTGGRSHTFTTSTGAATLYIELFDSVSGDILGRAADRQSIQNAGGRLSWSNSVTNSADAKRMIGGWADELIAFLDTHYK